MNDLNLETIEDIMLLAKVSAEKPLSHVAFAVALQDLHIPTTVHRHRLVLKGADGHAETIDGLALECNGNIFSAASGQGWENIEKNEKSFSSILFKESTGQEPVEIVFTHEKLPADKFKVFQKKTVQETASIAAVLAELMQKNELTLPSRTDKFKP